MMPKQEIKDIQFQMGKGLLGTEQYEFICLRLIDSLRQMEEENKKLKEKLDSIREYYPELLL